MNISRTGSIQIDEEEYVQIIKGIIRKDLRGYLGTGNVVIGTKDGGLISVTIDEIEIPTWRFGFPQEGIGQGDGEEGTDLGPTGEDGEEGEGKDAGQGHGKPRKVTIEFTPEEFEQYLEEAIELPRIKPKGDRTVFEEREVYNTLSRQGPRSMLHIRRTIIEALKRAISEGLFRPPDKTIIVPRNKDLWYKSYDVIREPKNNAVIIWKRDGSGSMGPEEQKIVSYLCDLCEFWLLRNYDRLERVYIIHDDQAHEVSRERFFGEHWGGGTTCSSALTKTLQIIEDRFPASNWNIYSNYLSDGFNWGSDNEVFLGLLRDKILPIVNQFSYGQVALSRPWWGAYQQSGATTFSGPGTLGKNIEEKFGQTENVALAEIKTGDYSSAIDAIRSWFKKGN